MKYLLIAAHGSRREASNDEVRELTATIREMLDQDIQGVECAFLELATPSIPDGLIKCIERGATHIVVSPYFLSAGRHVVEDVPNEIKKIRVDYPDITIEIAPYLGSASSIADIILRQALTPNLINA